MEKLREDWSIRKFMTLLEDGQISFDYPIQRKGGQWKDVQQSLLIHSIIEDYPIPSLFSIVEKEEKINSKGEPYEINVWQILDGKQRLTTIADYINGVYSLHEETPSVMVNGEDVVLAGQYFADIHPKLQEKIMICDLQMCRLNGATEEQIEDIFFRLQNGTPLTKQQQGKAKMGSEWSERFTDLCKTHPVFKYNAKFTDLQKRKADDEMTVIQTMMMMDENHELKSISSNHSFDYAVDFKQNSEQRLELFNRVVEGLDYIHEAFGTDQEKFLLKKIHMPMVIMTALHAKEMGVAPIRFKDWASEIEASYRGTKGCIPSDYRRKCGAGSVKALMARGRKEEMLKHFNTYISTPVEKGKEEVESIVDAVKAELEKGINQTPATTTEEKNDQVDIYSDTTTEEPIVTVEEPIVTIEEEITTEEPVVTIEEEKVDTVEIADSVIEIIHVTEESAPKVTAPKTTPKRNTRPKKDKPKDTAGLLD